MKIKSENSSSLIKPVFITYEGITGNVVGNKLMYKNYVYHYRRKMMSDKMFINKKKILNGLL